MAKLFPIIFILLWSSAFITTKPIIDYSDPFAALAFRFFVVSFGFFLFSIFFKNTLKTSVNNIIYALISGILFHGFYLGGVFYSISIGMPTGSHGQGFASLNQEHDDNETTREIIDTAIARTVKLFVDHPEKDTLYYSVNPNAPKDSMEIGTSIFRPEPEVLTQ